MDFGTNTEKTNIDLQQLNQECILLGIVKELCRESNGKLSAKLKNKVSKIIADCDLKHHASLQRVSTADDSTSTLLGFMHQTSTELTYDEQMELNQGFIDKIEKDLPICINELEKLKLGVETFNKLREDQSKLLKERDSELASLQDEEVEKMDLMMEWLNHCLNGLTKFGDNSSELLSLKTKIVNYKSKILHLQILQNIFTETNQSIKAYSEIHKDLKDSIRDTEQRIKEYQDIIDTDLI